MSDEFKQLRVLAVDDEPDVLLGLTMLAGSLGAETKGAGSGEEATSIAREWQPHLVVSDITMGKMSGLDLLDELRAAPSPPNVILVTGFGTIELAVSAMGRGASHFVTKPFDNDELLDAMRRFGKQALVAERVRAMRSDMRAAQIIAASPGMRNVLSRVEQVAPTSVSVLIRGESGVGKEIVARRIHERSAAGKNPFLAVNTAALPDTLLESELFGHKKGAFTGADRNRQGIFEQARGGTVFLDEIGLMSPLFQGKLLRVLQERTVVPLGSVEPVPVKFRLVAATGKGLRERIQKGEFREDLLYRLAVMTVDVPPLRDRREDIEPLATHFLSKYGGGSISASALRELSGHRWPGNVRELENCMQRALVLCGGSMIEPHHLGLHDAENWPGSERTDDHHAELTYEQGKQIAVQDFQRRFIERALSESGGNVSQAARMCGLTRAALQRIMRSLGFQKEQFRQA